MEPNTAELDTERMAQAIRAARLPLSQLALCARLEGVHGLGWQSTISALEHGTRTPTIAQMVAIERAGGKAPGFILRAAGYLPDPDTRAMLASDPRLSGAAMRSVLAVFDAVKDLP